MPSGRYQRQGFFLKMTAQISLRPPTACNLPSTTFIPPTVDQLTGTWHVVYSTLPLWKNKRNVNITYKPLAPITSSKQEVLQRIDDIVAYQTLTSDTIKTIHGIDTTSGEGTGNWDWRGTGWLKIVSSHWEILGVGEHLGDDWAIIFFASTLFTPSGVDILSKSRGGVPKGTVVAVKEALLKIEDPVLQKLAGDLFEVERD